MIGFDGWAVGGYSPRLDTSRRRGRSVRALPGLNDPPRLKVVLMLPVQRKTRSQSKMGRNHKSLRPIQSVLCPNCGSAKLPHAACRECGYVRPGLRIASSRED